MIGMFSGHARATLEEGVARKAETRAAAVGLLARRAEAGVRLAYYLTRDREAALDLSQEAFVRALESLSALNDPGRLEAWFDRILVNLCRDWERGQQVGRRVLEDNAGARPSAALDPAELVERDEEQRRVQKAVLALPQEYREAVVLVCVEGLTPQTAAGALDLPEGTLRWRLHEGRRLLREALGLTEEKRCDHGR